MTQPKRKLSTVPVSPHYDKRAAMQVDRVTVDGKRIENCVAYDMDAGWAFGRVKGIWQPKVHGEVKVVLK